MTTNSSQLSWITNYIWGIANDVLCSLKSRANRRQLERELGASVTCKFLSHAAGAREFAEMVRIGDERNLAHGLRRSLSVSSFKEGRVGSSMLKQEAIWLNDGAMKEAN